MKNVNRINKKVGLIALGCDKNRVDAEKLLANLVDYGFEISPTLEGSDVLIINTCAFLQTSRDEAIQEMDNAIQSKKDGLVEKIVVTGCLNSYIDDLPKEYLENVDLFLPIKENINIVNHVLELYNQANVECKLVTTRILTTPSHTAYLKIADGCNNGCSYCAIPKIRGAYYSIPKEELINEAKTLVQSGVVEIILIAQDVLRYGKDLYGDYKIVELIQELSLISGLRWIRLLYCYPELISEELLNEFDKNEKLCKYIDVPLQHVNDRILKSMNRRNNKQQATEIIKKLQQKGISIRSTFIVGYPGETRKEYKELIDFLKANKLDNVGFFEYSNERGTRSFSLPDQVDNVVKQKRCRKLYKLQTKIYKAKQKKMIGKEVVVLVDSFDESSNVYVGRTEQNSLDVDSVVLLVTNKSIQCGTFVKVHIIETKNIDLIGVVL